MKFEEWLKKMNIMDSDGKVQPITAGQQLLAKLPRALKAA